MRLEISRGLFCSRAKKIAAAALPQRSGFWVACLGAFVIQGCALIQGTPVNSVPADSQPAIVKTPITPPPPSIPATRPKAKAGERSTASGKSLQTGEASWYGPRFHGRTTASGDTFNQEAFTAAHASLPFGSKVRVTNLFNGKSVEVVINDRGPYVDNRIIDVSRAAAKALNMKKVGTTTVRLELVPDQ